MRKSVGLAAALVAYGSFLADAEAAYTTPYRYISPDGMRQLCFWQGGDPWSRTRSYGCVTATRAYECSVRNGQCFLTVYEGAPPPGIVIVPVPVGGHKRPPYTPPPTKQPPTSRPPVIPPGGTVVFPPKGPNPSDAGTYVAPPNRPGPSTSGAGTYVAPPNRPGPSTSGAGTYVAPPKGSGPSGGGKPPPGGGNPSGGGNPIKPN
jgi:hypothetical protein